MKKIKPTTGDYILFTLWGFLAFVMTAGMGWVVVEAIIEIVKHWAEFWSAFGGLVVGTSLLTIVCFLLGYIGTDSFNRVIDQ